MTSSSRLWIWPEELPVEAEAVFGSVPKPVATFLWNRGIRTAEALERFFSPDWQRDHLDPDEFTQMAAAVESVWRALRDSEMITVHGDYDADGVSGTAILVTTLREICRAMRAKGAVGFDEQKITWYLPHREHEGYGFQPATAERLAAERQTRLVITVDCGISNHAAIARGRELGVDTIVCDHHTLAPTLPEGAILIHPRLPGESYPNKHLCGAGVAFKLAVSVIRRAQKEGAAFPDGWEKWLLDLVAIATVTDVMPLVGENRLLEYYGLKVLAKARRPGIKQLLAVAGTAPDQVDTTVIGFQIGPRLNAAGRMDHASHALELLLAETDAEAFDRAQHLQQLNTARQQVSNAMVEQARAQVLQAPEARLQVAVGEGWSAGIVGLVAGKLLGEFGRPVLVVSKQDEVFVGSGRAPEGFDITAALASAAECFEKFGGHAQACGFTVHGQDHWQEAVARLTAYTDQQLINTDFAPRFAIDAEVFGSDVDWLLQTWVEKGAPYGAGHVRPVFGLREATVVQRDAVGNGKHARLTLRTSDGGRLKCIGFGMGARLQDVAIGATIAAAFELSVNEWNGRRELQLKLLDVQI